MGGIYYIFQRRGPKSFTSPFAQALLHNTRPVAVMHGLLRREPTFLSTPAWIETANQTPTLAVKLTNLALRIPVLLQKADALCASESPSKVRVIALLTELISLERDFHDALLRFYKLTSESGTPYHFVSIDQYASFRERCGGLTHVFPSVIEFPSFISATTHVYTWICLLVLRRTTLDVAALHPYPLIRTQKQEASLTAAASECAINLCQSVAYLTKSEHASCGIVACSGPLYFASEWFERQQSLQRLVWTRHTHDFLQREILLGGAHLTSLNIQRPIFTWYMLSDLMDTVKSEK